MYVEIHVPANFSYLLKLELSRFLRSQAAKKQNISIFDNEQDQQVFAKEGAFARSDNLVTARNGE